MAASAMSKDRLSFLRGCYALENEIRNLIDERLEDVHGYIRVLVSYFGEDMVSGFPSEFRWRY